VRALRELEPGIPKRMVSDNGTELTNIAVPRGNHRSVPWPYIATNLF